ncbi:hypothetical protein DFH27DRAFT_574522 [Peziza echinospora]|nr:hypothetical protein DFH27DRAFT_574522 [Peziza echinospora]
MAQNLTINLVIWQGDCPTVPSAVAKAVSKEIQRWVQTTAAHIPWIITPDLTRSADGDDLVSYELCFEHKELASNDHRRLDEYRQLSESLLMSDSTASANVCSQIPTILQRLNRELKLKPKAEGTSADNDFGAAFIVAMIQRSELPSPIFDANVSSFDGQRLLELWLSPPLHVAILATDILSWFRPQIVNLNILFGRGSTIGTEIENRCDVDPYVIFDALDFFSSFSPSVNRQATSVLQALQPPTNGTTKALTELSTTVIRELKELSGNDNITTHQVEQVHTHLWNLTTTAAEACKESRHWLKTERINTILSGTATILLICLRIYSPAMSTGAAFLLNGLGVMGIAATTQSAIRLTIATKKSKLSIDHYQTSYKTWLFLALLFFRSRGIEISDHQAFLNFGNQMAHLFAGINIDVLDEWGGLEYVKTFLNTETKRLEEISQKIASLEHTKQDLIPLCLSYIQKFNAGSLTTTA